LAVADWVELLPFGAEIVNTTLAPEAGEPLLVTVAVIGTVPGRAKLVPETARVTDTEGGVTTVAFAVSVVLVVAVAAIISTA